MSTPSSMFFTCPICVQGRYCPTTCGVADYMIRYKPGVTRELDDLVQALETIANLTQEAEETVVYMKDSTTSAQKSVPQGNTLSSLSLNIVFIQLHFSPPINLIRSFCLQQLLTYFRSVNHFL